MEMNAKVQTVLEIMAVIKRNKLDWPEQQEVLKRTYRELARDYFPLDKSTREFIYSLDGMGRGAVGIAQRFPTISQLCAADYLDLRRMGNVGDITLYRIYGKLLEEGYEPKWNPYNYR